MRTLFSYRVLLLLVLVFNITFIKAQHTPVQIDGDISLIPIADSVFIHATYHLTDGYGRIGSNGLVIIERGQAIMVDTPMDNDKTERLVKYLEDSMHVKLVKLIACHYHNDCLGGINTIHNRGIPSLANVLTIDKCRELGLPLPTTSFTDSLSFNFNGMKIECFFPGAGHTFDNITVWIPSERILFGGCLVKAYQSQNLGSTEESVLSAWEGSIQNIQIRYPDAKIIVPGHGAFGGSELLSRTIALVKNHNHEL